MARASYCPLFKWLLSRKDLHPSDKIVFAYLTERIGSNGDCWPSQRTIETDCGISRDTVIHCGERLEAAGLIEIQPGGSNTASRYRAVPGGGTKTVPPDAKRVVRESYQGGTKTVPTLVRKSGQINLTPLETPNISGKGKQPSPKTTKREEQAEAIVRAYIAKLKRPNDHCTTQARKNVATLLKAGKMPDDLLACATNYATAKVAEIGTQYVCAAKNFYGTAGEYEGYWPGWTPPETPPSDPGDAHARKLEDQRKRQASEGPCQ